ncbi:SGNH hydrolase superfamily [Sesbania bispinosa]|nr:SGNH hydrolase superfamily [Sesbania bispinosa]
MSRPHNMSLSVPAVIAFGDSILDTGNNNYIETSIKANFKPYGRDFIGQKATGRFSNGRLPSDLFVEIFGIKGALPPYLDPNLKIQDLLTGVCFASAGSGYDPITVEQASVLSVEDQLKMFKEYIGKLKATVGESRTAFILANSIVIISMGNNDIINTYFLTPYRKDEFDVEQYTSMLVNLSSKFIEELYQLGIRRIGVFGLPPVGCVPLQRTINGGKERECVEAVNQAAMIYNSKLSTSTMDLNNKLPPDARIVYLETYKETDDMIQHHDLYGFDVSDSACCGIANVEVGPLCSSLALKICEDASKYVFWDSYHPTERAYVILVSEILKNYSHKFL